MLRAAILGPVYQIHRKLIDESKSWSSTQAVHFQAQKTSHLFKRYGDAIHNKAHYREHLMRYTDFSMPGLTKRITTGGTTGTPFCFYRDIFAGRQKERAYIFDIWSEIGYKPFDLRVIYRGNIGKQLISYNLLENSYIISPAQLNRDNINIILRFLRGIEPFFLHVYPSSLLSLIDMLGEETIMSLPIRGILAGSEAFPHAQIHATEKRLRTQIAHWYGHSEYATLARYCRHCRGFHFYPTYGFTEFIGNTEGLHNIVATSFNSIGTRFIRYDTGDMGRLSEMVCEKPFYRIDSVVGRVQEYFIGRDGYRYAFGPFLFGIHNRFWELANVSQFIQKISGSISVYIVFKPNTSASDKAWVRNFLVSRFSPVDLDFSEVDFIPTTAAGKHRYFVSDIATESDA